MAKRSKDTQKDWFYTGAYPTAEQFHDVIDSTLGVLESVSSLPVAGAGNLGNEYKIGNAFYRCELSGGAYTWRQTATATPSNDYDDLANKPTINNVRIAGAIEDIDSLGALSKATSKYSSIEDNEISYADVMYINHGGVWRKTTVADVVEAMGLATRQSIEAFKSEVLNAAQAAVTAALDGKLDKDLSNIEATDTFPGDALVPVVTPSGIRKTTLRNVASYTEVTTNATRTVLSEAVKAQLKVMPITGEQNDSNVKFAVDDGFTTGTSVLYFNGQLLTAGKDYAEDSSYGIVMLTHIPSPSDVLVFMAVPLAFRKA